MNRISRVALLMGMVFMCSTGTVVANDSLNVENTIVQEKPNYITIEGLKDIFEVNYSDNGLGTKTFVISDGVHSITIYSTNPSMYTCECGYNNLKYPLINQNGKYMIASQDIVTIFGYSKNVKSDLYSNKVDYVKQKKILDGDNQFEEVLNHFVCDTNIGSSGAVLNSDRQEYVLGLCEEYLKSLEGIEEKITNKNLLELAEMRTKLVKSMVHVYTNFNEYSNEELGNICKERDKEVYLINSYLDSAESKYITKH